MLDISIGLSKAIQINPTTFQFSVTVAWTIQKGNTDRQYRWIIQWHGYFTIQYSGMDNTVQWHVVYLSLIHI